MKTLLSLVLFSLLSVLSLASSSVAHADLSVSVLINGQAYSCTPSGGAIPVGNVCQNATDEAKTTMKNCPVGNFGQVECFKMSFKSTTRPTNCAKWQDACMSACPADHLGQAECFRYCSQ